MYGLAILLSVIAACGIAEGGEITGQRIRRADDPAPLETVVMQLTEQLNQLQAQVAEDRDRVTQLQTNVNNLHRHVAFLVQFSASRDITVPAHAAYKFDKILLNDGNGYDATLGVFTAPYTGVYVLAVQTFTYNGENPLVDIRLNGGVLTRMSLDTRNLGDNEESTSATAVVRLHAGDRVWVEADGSWTLWGVHHTFFTGALLYTV